MSAKVLETLLSTETSESLAKFEFSTRSVAFPRGVSPPASSASPRVFAPHLVGAGADIQDAYDAAHGVVVVSPHASPEFDAATLVSNETAELMSASSVSSGARCISICLASVSGPDNICIRALDMLSTMASQGVAAQARLSFVRGKDAEAVMREVGATADVATDDTFLVTSTFWEGRLLRRVTPLLVLGSDRDGAAMERFKGNVMECVANTCPEMPVHPVFSSTTTDVTLSGSYARLVLRCRTNLQKLLVAPVPSHTTEWTANKPLTETGMYVRLTPGPFHLGEFKETDRLEMNSPHTCCGQLVCDRNHVLDVVSRVKDAQRAFKAEFVRNGWSIELPMALTYAIDERLADTASVCVLFAQTEKVDLSHLLSHHSRAGPVHRLTPCVRTVVSPVHAIAHMRGMFVVSSAEAFPADPTQRRVHTAYMAHMANAVERCRSLPASNAATCKKSMSQSTIDTQCAEVEQTSAPASESTSLPTTPTSEEHTCPPVDFDTMQKLVFLTRKRTKGVKTNLTKLARSIDKALAQDEKERAKKRKRNEEAEPADVLEAVTRCESEVVVVVCQGKESIPDVFSAGAGAAAVRVQPASVVNHQLPVVWLNSMSWTGEDTILVIV